MITRVQTIFNCATKFLNCRKCIISTLSGSLMPHEGILNAFVEVGKKFEQAASWSCHTAAVFLQ
jgi:hypothetical protein